MMLRKAYLDIEATYTGDIDPKRSQQDRDKFFKDFSNWKFVAEKDYKEKKVVYNGILGILKLDFEYDGTADIYKILDKKFVQLIGEEINKDSLMRELEGVNEIIGYHCRTKPGGPKGYIGYDFGVIAANFGIILEDLPGVKVIDLELLCHSAEIYGGLKKVEMQIPTVPPRKSGIENGEEEEKLLLDVAFCDDEDKKQELLERAKMYNKEDIFNLVYIEQYLRKLKIIDKEK